MNIDTIKQTLADYAVIENELIALYEGMIKCETDYCTAQGFQLKHGYLPIGEFEKFEEARRAVFYTDRRYGKPEHFYLQEFEISATGDGVKATFSYSDQSDVYYDSVTFSAFALDSDITLPNRCRLLFEEQLVAITKKMKDTEASQKRLASVQQAAAEAKERETYERLKEKFEK
jgi:hypothetical protein